VFDYHKGILSLLQFEFFGAAFALVRPMITDDRSRRPRSRSPQKLGRGLAGIQNDEYTVNFKLIGAKIDADFGLDQLMENFLSDVTRNALHSYTHSGLLQLGSRFDGNDIKPNYSDGETIEVIRVTTSAIFMVTNLVTKHFGFEEDWSKVTELYVEWGKHS
jgi:hypothetical protein